MPIYEYVCKNCKSRFEIMAGMGATAVVACPECSSMETVRLMSVSNVVYNGTGFYKNDYKNPNRNKKEEE